MNTYQSLEAMLHDAFWAEEGEPVELGFMEAVLRDMPGRSLEIGSGSGRLLLPLLQKGYSVEGLELSGEMLELCRGAAAMLGLEPVLHQADMTGFEAEKSYASVLVPAFTLQLAADPVAALENFHRLLQPEGQLYLSVFRPQAELLKELPENEWYDDHGTTLPDGRRATLRTRHRLDRKQRILFREHHYLLQGPDGDIEHLSSQTIRYFTPRQLAGMLARTGFTPLHAISGFDPHEPVDDDSQIFTVVARRD